MNWEPKMNVQEAVRLTKLRAMLSDGSVVRIRERAGLSRGEVACTVGVRTNTITSWETQTKRPKTRKALEYLSLIEGLGA